MCEIERLKKILISWIDDKYIIDNILADFLSHEEEEEEEKEEEEIHIATHISVVKKN